MLHAYKETSSKVTHRFIQVFRRRWRPGRFYAFLQNCEKWLLDPSCLSAWINSANIARIVIKSEIIFFRKSVEKIQVSLQLDKNSGYFTWRPITFFIISRSVLLRMRNVSDKSRRENQTGILCSVTFFLVSCYLWVNAENFCRAGEVTNDNMADAHFTLGTTGCKHIFRICNTYCFSTATMVALISSMLRYKYIVFCLKLLQ